MNEMPPIRILIAEDHSVVREGLVALLNRRPDMTVVAEVSNGREAVELYLQHRPDIALVDLRMPELDGVDVIIAIRREHPQARCIILTTFDHEEDIYRGLRAGAKAYLLKDAPREELLACLRAVHQGKTLIPPDIAAKLAAHIATSDSTPRDLGVLQVLADRHGHEEIADLLSISEGIVKTQLNVILCKLDAANRILAVAVAL